MLKKITNGYQGLRDPVQEMDRGIPIRCDNLAESFLL